jgi:hypothetical protein
VISHTRKTLSATPADNTERDYYFAVRLTSLTMLVTNLICYEVFFLQGRVYAPAPLISGLETLPHFFNVLLFAAGLAFLVWLLINPVRNLPKWGIIFCHLFFVLQDVTKLQPFYYMFLYTFLMAALFVQSKRTALTSIQIMVCGVYFWAGFHKINATFYLSIFPWFVSPVYDFSDTAIPEVIQVLASMALFATPFLEAAIGIFLIFSSTRIYASIIAFTMLVVVLMCLGPLGHNWSPVVWPWNVWIFWMEYQLICAAVNRDAPPLLSGMTRSGVITFLLFFIAPMLAFWSTWYAYPGFKLYAGNTLYAHVKSPPEETYENVPEPLRAALRKKHSLDVWDWTKSESGLRFPTEFAYKKGAAGLCKYLDFPAKATLVIVYPPPFNSLKRPEAIVPLCP